MFLVFTLLVSYVPHVSIVLAMHRLLLSIEIPSISSVFVHHVAHKHMSIIDGLFESLIRLDFDEVNFWVTHKPHKFGVEWDSSNITVNFNDCKDFQENCAGYCKSFHLVLLRNQKQNFQSWGVEAPKTGICSTTRWKCVLVWFNRWMYFIAVEKLRRCDASVFNALIVYRSEGCRVQEFSLLHRRLLCSSVWCVPWYFWLFFWDHPWHLQLAVHKCVL
jgi:hypothetical protein